MNNTNNLNLPPLPPSTAQGPEVCAAIHPYLAIFDDLPLEQAKLVLTHIQDCPECTDEFQQLTEATRLVSSLPGSEPLIRVDQAVQAAITLRGDFARIARQRRRRANLFRSGIVAAVAVLLLVVVSFQGLFLPAPQTFALPANLSWNGYVLHYSLVRQGTDGTDYLMDCYQDLGRQLLHAETSSPGRWDIVLVGDEHAMMGKDMMHQVVQENVDGWNTCDPQFNLTNLRQNMQQKQASYAGKSQFAGQEVYQIRYQSGIILLLDMHYRPVNVLQPMPGAQSREVYRPVYKEVALMPASQVGSDMWDRSIPPHFRPGTLSPMP